LINYFTGAISRIEGMGLDEIAKETLAKHSLRLQQKRNCHLKACLKVAFTNGSAEVKFTSI
jgi:hypothetical protein